jgi:hypothetical protein
MKVVYIQYSQVPRNKKMRIGENGELQYVASIPWSWPKLAEMFARPEQL